MNDEFLTKYHKTPRAAFADALYERISGQSQPRFAQTLGQRLTLRNSVIMIALLFVVAACVYAVTDRGWRKVGGIWVYVQTTYKLELTPHPETEWEAQPQELECLTVEETKEALRFDFHVPTWAPEGFTFPDRICGVDKFSGYAYLYWEGSDPYSVIQIMLSNMRYFSGSTQDYEIQEPSIWLPVAPGSYEEVQVHGRPAVLIRGDWEKPWWTGEMVESKYEFKWDKKRGLQLYWMDGQVFYELQTFADVSPEDLIKMAESAR
jgi:hypothetical protein